ncbi:hypothetical protein A7317_10380 [Pseudomonas fluorescens]|uniref:hypothetical protein n=1 Tax=Pseudomonas fluorescens TaxID=294 RepID=UPI00083CBBC8|nr:hypothetical protein [Pseudomonas fluorescens]AOE67390.1 hypothetical protein A7317_10380 [Pseudomonas fluorescens]AOE73203.1 hypothetical protein A7319_10370 [Pseudomonas fluorescens]
MTGDAIVGLILRDWVMLQMPGEFEHGGVELNRGTRPAWDLAAGELVGGRELKNFDRQALLLLAAMALVNDDNHGDTLVRSALIGATSNGSIDSVIQLIKESNDNRFAFQVNPAQIPNTVINSSLGQLAIKYGIKGANVSLCAKELSFYNALVQALRIARRGDSERLYATALETFSGEFGKRYLRAIERPAEERPDTAAVFSFEASTDTQAPGLVVRACVTGRLLAADPASLGALIRGCLAGQGVEPAEWRVSLAAPDAWPATCVALSDALGMPVDRLDRAKALSLSLVGAYQLAHLAKSIPAQGGGVMACVDEEGFYGVALIQRNAFQAAALTAPNHSSQAGSL